MRESNFKSFFAIIFIGSILFSCKKDTVGIADIEIGNKKKMFVQSFNITLDGDYNDPDVYDLDLNDDGVADISFTSAKGGSPQGGTIVKQSFVRCLNADVSIWMESFTDTTFLSISTSTLENNGYIWSIETTSQSCTQLNPGDPVHDISENAFVMPVEEGSILTNGTDFVSPVNHQPLIRKNFSSGLDQVSSNLDTIFYTSHSTYNECRLFPQGTYEYISVKLNVNGDDKLGWIKFRITDDNIISIVESAISL